MHLITMDMINIMSFSVAWGITLCSTAQSLQAGLLAPSVVRIITTTTYLYKGK